MSEIRHRIGSEGCTSESDSDPCVDPNLHFEGGGDTLVSLKAFSEESIWSEILKMYINVANNMQNNIMS